MKNHINAERRAEIGAEKRAKTKKIILSAAFSLLGRERGLSTRIEEICVQAGISRATFYNYFASMDDLFDALSYDIAHDFNDAVQAVIDDMPPGAIRSMSAIRYYLERAIHDPAWGWAMVNLSASGPIFGAETFHYAHISMAEGIDEGEFDVADIEVGRDMMLGTVLASMKTLLKGEKGADHIRLVVQQLLSALHVDTALARQCVDDPLPDIDRYMA